MNSKIRFTCEFISANCERVYNRICAVFQSISFRPGGLANVHFHRYTNYRTLERRIADMYLSENARIVEFGGSNGVIAKMFAPDHQVEIAPNFPEVDIQSLTSYENQCCDVVILDQILEHIPNPQAAIKECHRILRHKWDLYQYNTFTYPRSWLSQ